MMLYLAKRRMNGGDMSDKERDMQLRIDSEAQSGSPIKCRDLVCIDCAFRYDDTDPEKNGHLNSRGRMYGPTSVCAKFSIKPNAVLLGKDCSKYKRG